VFTLRHWVPRKPRSFRAHHQLQAPYRLWILVLAMPLLSSCWYIRQAGYFLEERLGGELLSKLAAQPDSSIEFKDFAANIEAIRHFAIHEAGLKPTKNYTRYITLERDYVASVVSACAADSFTRHYWKYPLLGALPYKGFYEEADAQKEAARLKAAGLDVIVRKVDGFSSLGFFRDPLYSFMLSYKPDELAELIFHESAHATLFIKGADQFNEEFATFVGLKATELFLAARYGQNNSYSRDRAARQNDRDKFREYLKSTAHQLELLYSDSKLTTAEKIQHKNRIIQERSEYYQNQVAELFSDQRYQTFDMSRINNAYLDLYRLYEEDLGLYQAWFELKAANDLPRFIVQLQEMAKRHGKHIKHLMAAELEQ